MIVESTGVPDVLLVKPKVFGDARGCFLEGWNARGFRAAGLPDQWAQDNIAHSQQGVLRGLHCQIPCPQGKLVRCVTGAIFDVAVDLRAGSRTFGKWCGEVLDATNWHALWVPPGFAHGYYVLSESATIYYKATDFYAPEHERCLRWDDPAIAIDWPILPGTSPILSAKDAVGVTLEEARLWK